MAGNCAIFRSWNTGDLLTASDLTTSFTTVGVTNLTPACMDDYALDVTQFRATTDPYPGSVASLPTSLAGEIERLRFVIKKLTGWTQWYTDTETITLPQPLTLSVPLGIGAAQTADAQVRLGGTWTGAVQTEGFRMNSSLTGVAGANAFGLIFVPTFIEAASGTHSQLTGIYVNPAFTDGAGTTTNIFGINIDMGAVGAIAPTTAAGLRINAPSGGGSNYALLVANGVSAFAGTVQAFTDNAQALGTSAIRWANAFLSTSVTVGGANPAVSGGLRMPNNSTLVAARNAANSADVTIAVDSSDRIVTGGTLAPGTDNAHDLGVSGANRYRDFYASNSFRIGGTFATVGSIRLVNNASVAWRNQANSADHLFTLDTNNNFTVTTHLFGSASASFDLGSDTTKWRDAFLSSSVRVGTNPAAAGAVRLANAVNISGRNAANGADVIMASVDSTDRVRLGPGSTGNIRMDGQVRCDIDASARLVLPVGTDKWAV